MKNCHIAKGIVLSLALGASFLSVSPIFAKSTYVDANGHAILRTNDAGRHVTIAIKYNPELDRFESYFDGHLDSVVDAADWFDPMITKNNAAITQEKEDVASAMTSLSSSRIEADTKLHAAADALSDGSIVHYDGADQSSVTFSGTDGTTITHVKDGVMAVGSTDAVTAGQVLTEQVKLDQEISDRKQALSSESDQRKQADDVLSQRIGTPDEMTSAVYIAKDASVADNLQTLDSEVYHGKQEIAAMKKANQERLSEEALVRGETDQALSDRIGSLSGLPSTYLSPDGSVSSNLVILDRETQHLSHSYDDTKNALDSLADTEKKERMDADKAFTDRIGTITNEDLTRYVSPDRSVSGNLVSLDQAVKENADAIKRETELRKKDVNDLSRDIAGSIDALHQTTSETGAAAAALAGLSYLPYEDNQRVNVGASIGHYGGETAAAVGGQYWFNQDASVNLGASVGSHQNMVSGGVSIKLGQGGGEARALRRMKMQKAVALSQKALQDAKDKNQWLSAEAAYYGDKDRTLPRRFRMAKLIHYRLSLGDHVDPNLLEEYQDELSYIESHENS